MVAHWITTLGWKEDRDELLFGEIRKLSKIRERRHKGMDERHENIAVSLEDLIEKLIAEHHNGDNKLTPKDVAALAKSLEVIQGVQKTSHGEAKGKVQHEHQHWLGTDQAMEGAAEMLSDLFGSAPETAPRLPDGNTMDAEFEVLDDAEDGPHGS